MDETGDTMLASRFESMSPRSQPSLEIDTYINGDTTLATRPEVGDHLTAHEAIRAKKAAEHGQQAIRSRIRYLAREEEKQWRTLEDVRRRASIIEEGRTRAIEKKLAQEQILSDRDRFAQSKSDLVRQCMRERNDRQQRVLEHKAIVNVERRHLQREKRAWSEDVLRHRKDAEEAERVEKAEKAVAMQKSRVQAFLQVCQEKAEMLDSIKQEKEVHRSVKAKEAMTEEQKLQELEVEEMKWVDRLKNSRTATQAALTELEGQFGGSSSLQIALQLKRISGVKDQVRLLNGEGEPTPRSSRRNSAGSSFNGEGPTPRSSRKGSQGSLQALQNGDPTPRSRAGTVGSMNGDHPTPRKSSTGTLDFNGDPTPRSRGGSMQGDSPCNKRMADQPQRRSPTGTTASNKGLREAFGNVNSNLSPKNAITSPLSARHKLGREN